MKIKLSLLCLGILCTFITHGQAKRAATTQVKKTNLGISVQGYPAGVIPTVNLERYHSETSSFLFRVGGNFVDRQDFSDENDEETGAGFGASVGYRKHFPVGNGKIVAGFHTDFWNLWIDWENDVGTAAETSGTTYTFVVQPWLEAGYFFNFKNASELGITVGFGREINAITSGNDVEQGFIGSITVQYYFPL